MIVSLQNADIQSAIAAHVLGMGINTAGKEVSVAFKVGRKGSGVTAQVAIHDVGTPSGLFANKAAASAKGKPGDAKIGVTPVTAAQTVPQVDTTVNPAPSVVQPEVAAEGEQIVELVDGGVPAETDAPVEAPAEPENAPTSTTSLFA